MYVDKICLSPRSIDFVLLFLAAALPLLFGIIGAGISVLLLILYIKVTKTHYLAKRVLLGLSFVGFIISIMGVFFLMTMESKGIDSIGEALVFAMIIKLGMLFLEVCPVIIALIDAIKLYKLYKKGL